MIKHFLLLLICLLSVQALEPSLSAFTDEEKQNLKPQPGHIEQCKEGFPYLAVGDFNLTEANYSSAVKNNKALLVIVTAEWCDYCCKFEETFADLKDNILSNKTLLHGVDVKLARATVENNPKIQDTVSKLPEFIFYYKEAPFIFEHSFEVTTVGEVLSKIIKPYRVLSTSEEMQDFIDRDIQVQKGDISFSALKIIGMYSKDDDLKDELKEFKNLADQYAIYRDLQFALTTKENVISPIYREKKNLWFPDYMRSTVLIIDRKHQVHKIDPTIDSEQMSDKIHWKGKELVEPLTLATQELLRRMKQPILMSFVDPTKENAFQSYISMLKEVAKQFEEKLNFVYMDNNESANKRELLGIYHDKVPAVGINFQNDPSLYPFPEDQEITKANLIKFARDFLDNKLVPLERKSSAHKVKPSEKHPLYKTLSNAVEVRFAQYDDLVYEEGTDVALLLFNPSDDKNLELFCKNYDKMAERFKALGINSVRIAYYDLNSNPPPPSIQVFTSPMLVFLPAYQKRPPYKIYTDVPKTLSMMLYIEKYADIRFKLPDLPHLPPEMHEEYYKQKKQIEEEKKKRNEKQEKSDEDSSDVKSNTQKRVVSDEL